MNNSLGNAISIVGHFLNTSIISDTDLQKIREVSNGLPDLSLVTGAGFECRLGEEELKTDFQVCFKPPQGNVDNRKKWCSKLNNLTYLHCNNKIWGRINNFFDSWNNEHSTLYSNVENSWLEFDNKDLNEKIPQPSIFFAPTGVGGEYYKSLNCLDDPQYFNWIFDDALKLLMWESLDNSTKQCLIKCFRLLPEKGKVFQIGVMLPRQSECKLVRICVSRIAPHEISSYLKRIEYLEPIEEIDTLINNLARFVDKIAINLSIGSDVHSKIGLECFIDDCSQGSSKWREFSEFLVRSKICTDREMNALFKWVGYSDERSDGGVWPDEFRLGASFLYPNIKSAIVRIIHHVKNYL